MNAVVWCFDLKIWGKKKHLSTQNLFGPKHIVTKALGLYQTCIISTHFFFWWDQELCWGHFHNSACRLIQPGVYRFFCVFLPLPFWLVANRSSQCAWRLSKKKKGGRKVYPRHAQQWKWDSTVKAVLWYRVIPAECRSMASTAWSGNGRAMTSQRLAQELSVFWVFSSSSFKFPIRQSVFFLKMFKVVWNTLAR